MKNMLSHLYFKLIFLLFIILSLVVSFLYYNYQNEIEIKENLKGITEESNIQINHVISKQLKNELHLLEAYASLLAQQEDITSEVAFQ